MRGLCLWVRGVRVDRVALNTGRKAFAHTYARRHTQSETHTGMLESWEHLLLYSQIELAITESKKQNKTSGALSSRGYKSERGGGVVRCMKMSQSESLKDSGSDWAINMPVVSKRTRGNGRNGTEQRALEGIKNTSERRGRACRGEQEARPTVEDWDTVKTAYLRLFCLLNL